MIRARRSNRAMLTAVVLLLALVGIASPAFAAPKQKIAVLGLEVQTAAVDPQDSQVAQAFTRELRSRAKDPTGTYQLAPGSERELIDEKLVNECTSDSTQCLGKIGSNLGTDQILWGKLEKAGGDYRVTLKILNVNTKTVDVWGPKPIAAKAAKMSALGELARSGYDTLTGSTSGGTIVLRSNAQTGRVFVNDEPKGSLAGGTLTIVSLPESRYKLRIEAEGFANWESETVTVRGGQTETIQADLVNLELGHERGGTVSEASSRTGWKVAAGVSIAVAAVAGGVGIWQFVQSRDYKDSNANVNFGGERADSSHCGKAVMGLPNDVKIFDDSCDALSRSRLLGVAAGVGAVAGVVFVYLATRGGDEVQPSNGTAVRRTKKKPAIAVTPIVSPQGGGATVRFDF